MNFKQALALIVAAIAIIHAQSPPPVPKFEAVSIKPCAPTSNSVALTQSPGRFTINCRTVLNLIRQSYITFANGSVLNLPAHEPPIEKGPAWINTDLYTIEAKAEGTPNQGTMFGPMMRALLEDRFQLKLHSEIRDVPVYDLTIAKSGPKLQPAQAGACRPLDVDHPPAPGQPRVPICGIASITANGFDVRGVTMADLARALRLDRAVIDKTGIAGTFDFPSLSAAELTAPLPPPPPPPTPGATPTPPASPSLADTVDTFAIIQSALQKFGLKLESAKGPGEFLVIDHIERPSEN
jgi:uncharacterized protein (TIGR03435 family)